MMLDLKHLIRLKLRGMSNRSIADLLGLDRNTVNRYVQWLDLFGIESLNYVNRNFDILLSPA